MMWANAARVILLLLVVSIISACATSISNYPNFDDFVAGKERVDIVFDSILFADLKGSDLGFDEETNTLGLQRLKSSIEISLQELGYVLNVVYSGHGVFYEADEDIQHFYVQNWEVSDQIFTPVSQQKPTSKWQSPEIQKYFHSLIEMAEQQNKLGKLGNKNGDQPIEYLAIDTVPEVIRELPSEILLYVQLEGKMRSIPRKVAQEILTGLASGLLTGGALIISGTSYDQFLLKIVAVDRIANKVVWFHERAITDLKSVANAAISSLGYYPLTEGRFMNREQREQWRKRVKSKQLPETNDVR